MFIEFNARYGYGLICNDIVNRVLVSIYVLCSGEQRTVCVHFHVIRVVMFFKRYSKCVAAAVRNSCVARGINRIAVAVLRRGNIQCICRKPRIYRHIFVKRRCFIDFCSADILSVPADKTVTGL